MKFCENELCGYSIDVSKQIILNGALLTVEDGEQVRIRHYPFRKGDKKIFFCEVCKNVIDIIDKF